VLSQNNLQPQDLGHLLLVVVVVVVVVVRCLVRVCSG
jgi:hypothetical protein